MRNAKKSFELVKTGDTSPTANRSKRTRGVIVIKLEKSTHLPSNVDPRKTFNEGTSDHNPIELLLGDGEPPTRTKTQSGWFKKKTAKLIQQTWKCRKGQF